MKTDKAPWPPRMFCFGGMIPDKNGMIMRWMGYSERDVDCAAVQEQYAMANPPLEFHRYLSLTEHQHLLAEETKRARADALALQAALEWVYDATFMRDVFTDKGTQYWNEHIQPLLSPEAKAARALSATGAEEKPKLSEKDKWAYGSGPGTLAENDDL